MSDKAVTPQQPDIWLQEHEEAGTADCGCHLEAEYRGETDSGNNSSPAFFFCPLHQAAANLLSALKLGHRRWARLHDIITDLIEEEKLTEADLPDDYQAIILALTGGKEAGAAAERAINAAQPPKVKAPTWFA